MKKYLVLLAGIAFFLAGAVFFYLGQHKEQSSGLSSTSQEAASSQEPVVSREPNQEGATDVEKLNKMIFAMNNKEAVEPQLDNIIKFAADNSASKPAQIYAGLAETAKLFKGIAWRLRDQVESADAAYIQIITGLRAIKRNNYRRGTHVDALFDYFVDPNPGEDILGQKGQFQTVAELQDWLAKKVAPVTERHIKTLKSFYNNSPKDEPLFLVDMTLAYGDGTKMTSKTMQHLKFMPGHLAAAIANVEERLGFVYYLASYDLEKLTRFMNTLLTQSFVAKKSDFQRGIIAKVFDIHLQSPKEVSETLQKSEFRDSRFLTLRPEAKNNNYLGKSLTILRDAAATRLIAFNQMKALADAPDQDLYIVTPSTIASRTILTGPVLEKRIRLLNATGPTPFTDRVVNESFSLNISALFDVNNPKIQDLKTFYPNQFVKVKEKEGSNPKTFKWNYEYGEAVGWRDPTFGGLLPDTANGAQYKYKLKSLSRDASVAALQDWLRLFY